jgi:hypothetical protein
VAAAGQAFLELLAGDAALEKLARQLLQLAAGERIPLRQAAEASSSLKLAEQLRRSDRPGWTVLATDVTACPGSEPGAGPCRTAPRPSTKRAGPWPSCTKAP